MNTTIRGAIVRTSNYGIGSAGVRDIAPKMPGRSFNVKVRQGSALNRVTTSAAAKCALAALLLATLLLATISPAFAEEIDLQVIHRIKTEAFHHSKVMDTYT